MADGLELLVQATAAGLVVWTEGDELVVRGPKAAEGIAMELLAHQRDVLPHVSEVSPICAYGPMSGPAYVSPKHPTCPTCGFTMWCSQCGGCRRCRGEAEGHHVDKATVDARRQESVERLLSRLRNGHTWLTEVHLQLLEEREVYEGLEDRFLEAFDSWDAMDQMLRELYSYQGCVVGPGQRCPDESPVSCRACSVSQASKV